MPVPTTINDLSLIPANNFPLGNVDGPATIDNYQRQHASFLAELRDSRTALSVNTDPLKGAGLIGFTPTGIGATPTNVQAALDVLNQKPTVSFYDGDDQSGQLPKIQRMADRVFVGDAAIANASFAGGGAGSWLGITPQPRLGYLIRDAQLAAVSTHGLIGLMGASRSSDQSKLPAGHTSPPAIGVAGMGYADRANIGAWGGYFDCKRAQGAQAAFAVELEVADLGTDGVAINPTGTFGSFGLFQVTAGAWIGAGADPNVNPVTYDCTAGVVLLNNGAKFKTGLLIRSDALTMIGGEKQAVYMGQDSSLLWDANTGGIAARIKSAVTSAGSLQEILFLNNEMRMYSAGQQSFRIDATAGATNNLTVRASGPGAGVGVYAEGADTNINVFLSPKGAGLVQFGVFTAGALATTGSITMVDAGGTVRRLLVG